MNVSGGDEGEREEVRTRLGSPRINHGLDLISEIWDGNSAIKMSAGNFDDNRALENLFFFTEKLFIDVSTPLCRRRRPKPLIPGKVTLARNMNDTFRHL